MFSQGKIASFLLFVLLAVFNKALGAPPLTHLDQLDESAEEHLNQEAQHVVGIRKLENGLSSDIADFEENEAELIEDYLQANMDTNVLQPHPHSRAKRSKSRVRFFPGSLRRSANYVA